MRRRSNNERLGRCSDVGSDVPLPGCGWAIVTLMLPEDLDALLNAAEVGWVRFDGGVAVASNAAAAGIDLVKPLAGWRERLAPASRPIFDEALACTEVGAAPTTLRVELDGGAAAKTVRLVLRRLVDGALDVLIFDDTALVTAERDLAEACELIALLPPHVFWEAADISKQRTIQLRLEAMVAERTAELERQVAERERAERAALAASRAKSEFLTNISHELRTPLNVVIGYAELLLGELADGEVDRSALAADIGEIANAGSFLLQLVTELLDLSKIEAGKMDLREVEVELGPWLSALVSPFERIARARGNCCKVELDPEIGVLAVDDFKLRQIINNLVGNACKFTEHGLITVSAGLSDEGRVVTIEVCDTGIGISPEHLETVFEPFVRASVVAADGGGSTGLGLSISRRYAELMGGSLSAESQLGVGTTLRLTIPRSRL